MKLKFRANSKDWTIFIVFCIAWFLVIDLLVININSFLNEEGFTGFEDVNYPSTATLGAEKGNPIIKKMMDWYENNDFILYEDWRDYIRNQRTSTCVQSNILSELGINRKRNEIQHIEHFTVYPTTYFFTKDEGYTYHSFGGSW